MGVGCVDSGWEGHCGEVGGVIYMWGVSDGEGEGKAEAERGEGGTKRSLLGW